MEIARALPDNRPLRSVGGEMLDSTAGETFGAVFNTDTMMELVQREFDLSRAEAGGQRSGRNARFRGEGDPEPRLAPDDLNERFGDSGVAFDTAMTEDAARIIADARRAQRIRDDVIARGPGGLMGGLAVLGGSLAAMAVDPLEVASAFIPVVGPGARAALTARAGRIGGRAIEGAIEGVIGNAIVEPLYYGLSQRQQQDYDAYDALANVALGGALGLGLGGAAGLVSKLRRGQAERARLAEIEESVAAFDRAVAATNRAAETSRVALAQMVQGRTVDVGPMMAPMKRPKTLLETIADWGGVADYEGDLVSMGLRDWDKGRPFKKNALRPDGEKQDILAKQLWEKGWFREEPEANEMHGAAAGLNPEPNLGAILQRKIDEELAGNLVFRDANDTAEWQAYQDQISTVEGRAEVLKELEAIGIENPRMSDLDDTVEIMRREGVSADVAYERAAMEGYERDVMDMAARENDPTRDFSGDPVASVEAQRVANETYDLDGDLNDLSDTIGQLELTENEIAFLGEADDMIAKAAVYREASRAAALCLAR